MYMHGALACMHMRHMRVCTSACVFAHACLHIRASLSIAFCISPADSFCSFRFAHSVHIFLSCLSCRPNTFSTFPFPIPLLINFCVKAHCRQGCAQCAALEGRALPGRGPGRGTAGRALLQSQPSGAGLRALSTHQSPPHPPLLEHI